MGAFGSPELEPVKSKLNDPDYEKNVGMNKNKKLTKCKTCNQYIARSAKVCPYCGAKNKKSLFKRWWFWVLIVLVLLSFVSSPNNSISNNAKTMRAEEYKEFCKLVPYSELARTPDEYKSIDIKSGGKVLQIMDVAGTQILRIQANGDMNDVFAVRYKTGSSDEKFLENDIVNFYGAFNGLEKYKTVFGKEILVPSINAAYVVRTTADAMLSDKPSKEFVIGEIAEYDGRILTITKVETSKGSGYSKPEKGKIFYIISLTLENRGSEKITYSPYDFKIQNEHGQIDGYSWTTPSGIEQMGSGELAPQGKIEDKLVFQEPENSTKLILQYYTNMFDSQSTFQIRIK